MIVVGVTSKAAYYQGSELGRWVLGLRGGVVLGEVVWSEAEAHVYVVPGSAERAALARVSGSGERGLREEARAGRAAVAWCWPVVGAPKGARAAKKEVLAERMRTVRDADLMWDFGRS